MDTANHNVLQFVSAAAQVVNIVYIIISLFHFFSFLSLVTDPYFFVFVSLRRRK